MLFMIVFLVVYVLLILQSVAFFTLVERHFLGLTQNRYGPKKTSYYGLLQPIMDGLKLVGKEQLVVFNCSPSMFLGVVLLSFTIMYMEFVCLPYTFNILTLYMSYLLLLVLLGVNVYFMIMSGIYSKNKYSYIGGMRGAVASISYEISFSLSTITFMLFNKSFTLENISNVGLLVLLLSFFVSVLVELGRTPFDYLESESELVSGFNTEYSSVGFVLIFLKEYGSLLFFSSVLSVVFCNGQFIMLVFFFSLFVVVRSSYPRLRYDTLMSLMWLQVFFHTTVVLWCTWMLFVM